jgi:hypothetical protein
MNDNLKKLMRSALVGYEAAGVDGSEGARAMREGLNRIKELEAKLAKAVDLLEAWINVATHCTIEEGVCCCGENMDSSHPNPMHCGHSPVDHGAYVAMNLLEETDTTLAELTGGKDE